MAPAVPASAACIDTSVTSTSSAVTADCSSGVFSGDVEQPPIINTVNPNAMAAVRFSFIDF
jgi:hypothetical protein